MLTLQFSQLWLELKWSVVLILKGKRDVIKLDESVVFCSLRLNTRRRQRPRLTARCLPPRPHHLVSSSSQHHVFQTENFNSFLGPIHTGHGNPRKWQTAKKKKKEKDRQERNTQGIFMQICFRVLR